jgi:hypothetical protein
MGINLKAATLDTKHYNPAADIAAFPGRHIAPLAP